MVTFDALAEKQEKIAVVGLGYVGLPLAVHLSRHFDVVGYDFKSSRIAELKSGKDRSHPGSPGIRAQKPARVAVANVPWPTQTPSDP